MSTNIQWTDDTWNPIAAFDKATGKRGWYCARVSPGCEHCYAEKMNTWRGNGQLYRVPNAAKVDIRIVDRVLAKPLSWRTPRKVFVCSMTDLFLDEHTDAMIARVFAVMAVARQHTFQVLTKRPARMRSWLADRDRLEDIYAEWPSISGAPEEVAAWPLPNVWLGVSVEDQQRADERIPLLLRTPAAVRFLSCEPLLGPIDFDECGSRGGEDGDPFAFSALAGADGLEPEIPGINWVIVGGESGPGARPCDVDWITSIVADCDLNGVACFVKQLGACSGFKAENEWRRGNPSPGFHHYDQAARLYIKRLGDSHGGDPDEWPEELRVRQFPNQFPAQTEASV